MWCKDVTDFFVALTCGIENGRCEEMCSNMEGGVFCRCPNNETIADGRVCLCKKLCTCHITVFTIMFNVLYSSVTVFHIVR